MRYPVYITEAAKAAEASPPIKVMQDKVSLWTWSVVHCGTCGRRQVVRKSILDGRVERLTNDEVCQCLVFNRDEVVPTACAVIWSES